MARPCITHVADAPAADLSVFGEQGAGLGRTHG